MIRAAATALLALALVAAGACGERDRKAPDFGRGSPTPAAERLPTPEPPPEGAWALVVDSASNGCGVGAPPEVVYLAGDATEWQVALQPFFLDASGPLRGDELVLHGHAEVILRPTVDCVLEERDTWALRRTAPGALAGELVRTRTPRVGLACAAAAPEGVELPCTSRWAVRLEHRSAKRAP